MVTKPSGMLENRTPAIISKRLDEKKDQTRREVKSYKPLEQINSAFEKKNIQLSAK